MLTNHSTSTYSYLPLVMRCLQKNPTQVLIAIRTTDVGVATFSLTLNNRHSTEKEQISTPLPAKALNAPPTVPERKICTLVTCRVYLSKLLINLSLS